MKISPDLLQSFIAVAEMRSFTLAARRLGLQQSIVSQHLKRLEEIVQRQLLARDTHSVTPTAQGEALVGQVLDANARVATLFAGPALQGHLRLGVPKDFVHSGVTGVLAAFADSHPTVELALTSA